MVSDNTQPYGTNAISSFSVSFLGTQASNNSASHRDLGFAGSLSGNWYAVYGDTLWCAPGVTSIEDDTAGFHGMVRDSLSLLTDDPLLVTDLHLNDDKPVPHQKQLIPYHEEWGESNQTGFGGTSIVESSDGVGAVYYLINNDEDYKHAGVAKLEMVDGEPTVVERLGDDGWWWDTDKTAKFGDIAAYRDSDYIYVLGHPPNSETGWLAEQYVYQARVEPSQAFNLSAYEYWWGRKEGWKSDLLDRFDTETAVMWGVGQGQIVYSKHFELYLYVHVAGNQVSIKTAEKAEGPWSASKEIYEATPLNNAMVYAAVAYPYLDDTGKTLTVGYTNDNRIQVIKITFD